MKNMEQLMKQAQAMQKQFLDAQQSLEVREFVGESGGGAVKVTIKGNYRICNVEIDSAKVDSDPDLLADLFAAAYNNAHEYLMAEAKRLVSSIPGMPALPF